ncbi:unconventional myosin-VI isoform X1 [Hydra vulgaris]|uniref:unconventional myosin-VI isoform X1 n=1 Tax=Hydra vulgaris TaxID=6087 RepID=UPI001F5FC6E2|nr:unconventional myosin-VI [Hydra vulgaris]XP_047128331.1 unconventional myosin-VI [Hydra vulgaris]
MPPSINFNENKSVWTPDGRNGFCLGRIVDIGSDAITLELIENPQKRVVAPYNRVYASEDDGEKDYEDNCSLMHLNEATLLHNLRLRYKRKKIYTYVANILIALNPYQEIPDLYTKETIAKYKGKSLGVLPPHVFAIADKSYRDMKVLKLSQSIIVSGESGAGKTESTKYILRYLTETCGASTKIEQRILEANPLLEAFGNSKTLRNLNSSRFGKYVEVHFDAQANVSGAFISHYLLEKSRICRQNPGERNYHIFYRMCTGAPSDMKKALGLSETAMFNYLNKGSLNEKEINDAKDFTLLDNAMNAVGITLTQKSDIYRVTAAVLHLGNIEFQESISDKKGGCQVTSTSEKFVSNAAKLLGIQVDELLMALSTRIMMTAKGGGMGTTYKIPLKPEQSAAGRDALAKSIYSKLFDYIVGCVNQCFPYQSSQSYIGVLDIAGFEFFEVNSFEQLCINYCNEKLQQFFNQRILKEEQALYDKEGLGVKNVSYADNQDCIELFEMKTIGIMDMLDEEMKFPSPSDVHFTNEVHAKQSKHFRLAVPRKSPLPIHRNVKDDAGFLIRHFAGAVCYQTAGFLEKNNDALHDNLEQLLLESSDPFIKSLFPISKVNNMKSKKLTFESVGMKFRNQLTLLIEKLRSTSSNFVRCIKPNDAMKSSDFEGGQILSQLQCAGMVSVLELMQEGYPSRTSFTDLHSKYKSYLPEKLSCLNPRTFCQALFRAVGIENGNFKFGMSKAFFRPGKFAEFDQLMRSDPETLKVLVSKVQKWIIINRWKRIIWGALSVQKLANKIKYRQEMLVCIQKNIRMFLAKKKHKPRYKALEKMRTLHGQLNQLMEMVSMLKNDKDIFNKQVQVLTNDVNNSIKQIQNNIMSESQMTTRYNELVQQISKQLSVLQSQVTVEKEQEKVRKLQEQMELEKKKRIEEENLKIQEEQLRKDRLAKEAKMKEEAEAAERKRHEEEQKNKLANESRKNEDLRELLLLEQREEQQRRDYELALRLAADPSTMDSEDLMQIKRTSNESDPKSAKYNLKKWSYSELRDTINNSCDLELLEACRVEFHRRLKVYHAWRKRNINKTESAPNAQRAPADIVRQCEVSSFIPRIETSKNTNSNAQRYFRVPFSKPSDQYRDPAYKKVGYWYAHFDGEWVARQLEIHPNGALLLIAGYNDMDICELSLSETRLMERPGAEITCDEFNDVWVHYGGKLDQDFKAKQRK